MQFPDPTSKLNMEFVLSVVTQRAPLLGVRILFLSFIYWGPLLYAKFNKVIYTDLHTHSTMSRSSQKRTQYIGIWVPMTYKNQESHNR